MTDEADNKAKKPEPRRPGGRSGAVRWVEEIRQESEEGKREVKLSTVEKASGFFAGLGRAVGALAGVTLILAGVYAVLSAAMWLIFESGRVMTLMGWYGLLIPAALLATPMLALKWALSTRKRTRSSGRESRQKAEVPARGPARDDRGGAKPAKKGSAK
jgi:hypothetical protein